MVEFVKPSASRLRFMAQSEQAEQSRAEVRREQRKALIVSAAEAQLAEAGIAGATLELVGKRVGLSKGALYYYVDGRDDLLALVLDDILADTRATAARLTDPTSSPLEKLLAFAKAHVTVVTERPAGRLIVGNVDSLATNEKSAALLREQELMVRNYIRDAIAAEELRDMSPAVASTVFFGSLNTMCRTFNPDGNMTRDEMLDATLDLTLNAWTTATPGLRA